MSQRAPKQTRFSFLKKWVVPGALGAAALGLVSFLAFSSSGSEQNSPMPAERFTHDITADGLRIARQTYHPNTDKRIGYRAYYPQRGRLCEAFSVGARDRICVPITDGDLPELEDYARKAGYKGNVDARFLPMSKVTLVLE